MRADASGERDERVRGTRVARGGGALGNGEDENAWAAAAAADDPINDKDAEEETETETFRAGCGRAGMLCGGEAAAVPARSVNAPRAGNAGPWSALRARCSALLRRVMALRESLRLQAVAAACLALAWSGAALASSAQLAGVAGRYAAASLALKLLRRVLLLASLALSGVPALIESAIAMVRAPSVSVDLLMTLAAVLSLVTGHMMEGALLMVLFSLSRAAENAINQRARGDLDALRDLVPEHAWRLSSASASEQAAEQFADEAAAEAQQIPVRDIQVGDVLLVKTGELAPCDARVVRGGVYVTLEHLTGESMPRRIDPGDEVASGARVMDGSMVVRSERRTDESTVARIARLVTAAQRNKPSLQRFIDRFGRAYSRLVLLGAALVLLLSAPVHNVQWRSVVAAPGAGRAVDSGTAARPWRARRWKLRPPAERIGLTGQSGAVNRALGFLVVTSPCALVISAPIAYLSALGALARRGVLVKGGARTVEASAQCERVAFDKTGTLTMGRPMLERVRVQSTTQRRWRQQTSSAAPVTTSASAEYGTDGDGGSTLQHDQDDTDAVAAPSRAAGMAATDEQRRVLGMAAALEAHAVHPIARAVVEAAQYAGVLAPPLSDFRAHAGHGIEGVIRGAHVRIGRAEFALALLADTNGALEFVRREQQHAAVTRADGGTNHRRHDHRRSRHGGSSVSTLCADDGTVAVLHFIDALRPEAAQCVAELRRDGYAVAMLTGDNEASAMAIAASSGIAPDGVRYGMTPDDKLRFAETETKLVMVGDGINDAPALARADCGVAVGFTSATAVAASDVILVHGDSGGGDGGGDERASGVSRLAWYLRKSRATQQLVVQNVVVALALILVTAVGAVLGGLPLWAAVVVHEGGTLLVGLNGLRLLFD